MPIFEKSSKPLICQSITKFVAVDENFLTLCLLAWTSSSGTYVCVFDLNQWYKQHMPDTCDWRSSPTFLAIFPLGKQSVLDVWMNGITVTPFSSLNRPEEHFYPSSLSFGLIVRITISDFSNATSSSYFRLCVALDKWFGQTSLAGFTKSSVGKFKRMRTICDIRTKSLFCWDGSCIVDSAIHWLFVWHESIAGKLSTRFSKVASTFLMPIYETDERRSKIDLSHLM